MSGYQISFELEGEKQLSRRLRMVADSVQDMRPAFKKVSAKLKNTFEDDVFMTEGSVIGSRWQPLSPAYRQWKARNYPGRGILQRTGRMQKGFRSTFGKDYSEISNKVDYFKYHQSRIPRSRGLPRRPMMRLHFIQREQVQKIIQKHISDSIKKV